MDFVKLFEPQNAGELALVKSLLDANKIEYYVQNEHLGGLYNLPVLPYGVMVRRTQFTRATTLLSLLRDRKDEGSSEKWGQVVRLPSYRSARYS